MKLGICGAPAQLCTARALGYDYFETSAVGIAAMTPSEFAAFAEQNRVLRSGRFAGCLVCNGLFPGGLALVGPAADEQKIAAYLSGLLPRLRQLGVRKVVFGSGSARRCPEGTAPQQAHRQLQAAARLAEGFLTGAGIAVGMEHLNRAETNLLNTLTQTLEFVRRVGEPGLGVTVDFFHLQQENEPLSVLEQAAGMVTHAHTASPARQGLQPQDLPQQQAQAAALAAAGYDGTLSVEAAFAAFEAEGAASLAVLRQVYG